MSESKLKWEPSGSAILTKRLTDSREASYSILKGAGEYILRSTVYQVNKFSDLESAKEYAERLEANK
jgi:hypothetical protein